MLGGSVQDFMSMFILEANQLRMYICMYVYCAVYAMSQNRSQKYENSLIWMVVI